MAFSSEYTLLEDLSVELRGVNTFLLWVSAQWTRICGHAIAFIIGANGQVIVSGIIDISKRVFTWAQKKLEGLKSLQACPAKTYSVECSICLSSFREGHAAAVLFCGHVFHPNCELHWRKYSILNNYDHSTCATCRARYTVASVRQIQLHFGACEGCELKDNKLENLRSQLDVLQSENRQLREFLTAATTATTTAAADSITSSVAPQTIEVKKIQQIIRSKKSHRRNWKQRKDQSAV